MGSTAPPRLHQAHWEWPSAVPGPFAALGAVRRRLPRLMPPTPCHSAAGGILIQLFPEALRIISGQATGPLNYVLGHRVSFEAQRVPTGT